MLMDSDNRGVDHLDSGIVGSRKRVYDAAPDTSPPPEAVTASRIRAERIRQIAQGASDLRTQKIPLMTRRSFTLGTPRGLLASIGLMAVHSWSASS
ncbi:hypothetical protein ABIB68_007178 [Bradyrhizobium sp. F1.2.2]